MTVNYTQYDPQRYIIDGSSVILMTQGTTEEDSSGTALTHFPYGDSLFAQ